MPRPRARRTIETTPVAPGRRRDGERGQALVLVTIMITVLLGFAAVAVDMGRFVSERRFLQNAADAAALAGSFALSTGKTAAEAEAAARASLTKNFANEPTGKVPALPSTVPVYEAGHVGDPRYLDDGIWIGTETVRVAVKNDVDFTFGRLFGFVDQEIRARAHAGVDGGLLPIAVREFIKGPGPQPGAAAPCSHDETRFMSVFSTANTACLGSETDASQRTEPSSGAPFNAGSPNSDPANHGPIIAILGQGADPSNASDFRGFIALDIRNFATTTSQQFYNGVTPALNENQVKDVETEWIMRPGYPGPGFPSVVSPPNPLNQVSILSGNSAGLGVDAMFTRFAPGDEILITVYPGYVMAVPDFLMTTPDTITIGTTESIVGDASDFRVSRNQAFSGQVTFSVLADTLDAENPMVLGTLTSSPAVDFDPNPVTPALGGGTVVDIDDVATTNAVPGVYALWVRGQAGSPYLTAKRVPLAIKVGDVVRDFTLSADATGKVAAAAGDTVTFTLVLQNAPSRNTNFGNSVALSVDSPLPGGMSYSMSSSATPSRDGTNVTLQVHTGGMTTGTHEFVVRATGMNGDPTPRKVTHLLPLSVNVAPANVAGNQEYLDITGFAVVRITSITSNTVFAYAITPAIPDMYDPRLRAGKPPRLLPW